MKDYKKCVDNTKEFLNTFNKDLESILGRTKIHDSTPELQTNRIEVKQMDSTKKDLNSFLSNFSSKLKTNVELEKTSKVDISSGNLLNYGNINFIPKFMNK